MIGRYRRVRVAVREGSRHPRGSLAHVSSRTCSGLCHSSADEWGAPLEPSSMGAIICHFRGTQSRIVTWRHRFMSEEALTPPRAVDRLRLQWPLLLEPPLKFRYAPSSNDDTIWGRHGHIDGDEYTHHLRAHVHPISRAHNVTYEER